MTSVSKDIIDIICTELINQFLNLTVFALSQRTVESK